MKAGFYTLGCKLNQCETEALADAFRSAGCEAVGIDEAADIYIFNTCTVTSKSEQKARRLLRRILAERSGVPLIVTGCYAELEKAGLENLGRRVFVLGFDKKAALLELPAFLVRSAAAFSGNTFEAVAAFCAQSRPRREPNDSFRFHASRCSFHTRAFLKIQDGCDNRCSYCRVPLARGPSVSLAAGEVVSRFRGLESEGYKEIVLTGVNLLAYRWEGIGFEGLLERLLASAAGVSRVRISSLEPEGISPSLVRILSHPRICPHFHLPVQSGSDSVLRAMGRRYDRRVLAEAVGRLRSARNNPFIAADIITGFPGETARDHSQTETLVRDLGFASLHVFPFSPRPGTAAWRMKNPVPERLSRERAAALRGLSGEGWTEYAQSLIGQCLDVLVEEDTAGGDWKGLSANYMTVRGRENSRQAVPGALLPVVIRGAGKGFLFGEIFST
jgi:threonylcarbamoyladenosine tRNA methylthiotransferase MtaB